MPSLQSIRRKIGTVKNIQKITKAMKMVAVAKLTRTQDRILAAQPYAHKMREAICDLSQRVNREAHPLLQRREGNRIVVTVVTSDRGMCGAFNANILRTAVSALKNFESRGAQVEVATVGRKRRDFFRRRHWPVRRKVVDIFEKLLFEHGLVMGQELRALEDYAEGQLDGIYVIYNEFKSPVQQRVVVEQLLPMDWFYEISAAGASTGETDRRGKNSRRNPRTTGLLGGRPRLKTTSPGGNVSARRFRLTVHQGTG